MNLNRFGAPPGINYFNLVRPQIQTQQMLGNLQQQQSLLAANAAAAGMPVAPLDQQPPVSTTGHPVHYFDWSRYFPLQGLPPGSYVTGAPPGTGVNAGFGNPALRAGSNTRFGIIVNP
jgi:hypothetical protein